MPHDVASVAPHVVVLLPEVLHFLLLKVQETVAPCAYQYAHKGSLRMGKRMKRRTESQRAGGRLLGLLLGESVVGFVIGSVKLSLAAAKHRM